MLYYIRAVFDIIIKATNRQEARDKFIERAHKYQGYHLQADSIEIEEIKD